MFEEGALVTDLELLRQDLEEMTAAVKGAMSIIVQAHAALMEQKPTKAKSLLLLGMAADACEIEWSEVADTEEEARA